MRFYETYNTVFIVGADEEVGNSIRENLRKFFSFWKPSVQITEFKNYFDFLLSDNHGSALVITSEHGLNEMENPNVFRLVKGKFDHARIVHCYQDLSPDKLDFDQKKCVENFVPLTGNYTLQLNRLMREINQF